MVGIFKPLMRNGVLRKEIYSDKNTGLYNSSDVILSPTNDINVNTTTIDQAARSNVVFFSRDLTAVDIAVGDAVSFGAGVWYKITSVRNCRMYATRGADGTAQAGTKGVRVECTADREETAARLLIASINNWQCTITGGATESLIASKIKAYATDSVTAGVQSGWGSAHGSPKLRAVAVLATTDVSDSDYVDITSLIGQTVTISDANAIAYKISQVANQLRSVSTVKLIVGFDPASIATAPLYASIVEGYNTALPISADWFNQSAIANDGKLIISLGNQSLETPVPSNIPQETETISDTQSYHVSDYDEYGIARKVTVNGILYNLPVIEINPSASALQENKLKIATYTSGSATQAEIVTGLISALTPLLEAGASKVPLLSAAIKPIMDNSIPPEFRDALSYVMYQLVPGLQSLGTPAQSLMGKHSTGSGNLGIFSGFSFYASYPIVEAPAYVSGISTGVNNGAVDGQTFLSTLQPGEYNISAYPLPTYTLSPQAAACVRDIKGILSDLIIA